MTPSRPVRGEIVGDLGCGIRCRGFSRARWYSRCRSFDVMSTYRIVISGSAWPSNFINAGKVTLERIISLADLCRLFRVRNSRHTWATELLNCGIGLPALMKLMGHKSIQMTLRYLKVAQPDLQREFYRARQNSTQPYTLPSLSVSTATPDLPGIRQALAATRHLLEMYRRQFSDDKTRRRLQRLDHRLLAIAQQLQNIAGPEK